MSEDREDLRELPKVKNELYPDEDDDDIFYKIVGLILIASVIIGLYFKFHQ